MHLSHQELREDVLQLAQLLIESHPDPYSAGGGPLAFHRRVAEILEVLGYKLKHSGLGGNISCKRSLYFPNDPERGKLFRPDHELTYEYFMSRNFDPHATISLALEHLTD